MKKLFLLLLGAGLIAGLIQGCGSNEEPVQYASDAYGASFFIPAGWELVEEKKRETVLTLQLQNRNRESSFITVVVFPAELFTRDEAVDQAEMMLRQSLYAVEEPERSEIFLDSGEPLPLVAARAGGRDIITASIAASPRNTLIQASGGLPASRRWSSMADLPGAQESAYLYPEGPAGALWRPTGPWNVGRPILCATPGRRLRRCSTHPEGHRPRGPPLPPDPAGSAVR